MTLPERSAAEAARELADALERAAIPYAIGGALSLAVAGVPRGTADVDINVFVPVSATPHVLATLAECGVSADEDASLARAEHDGMFVGRWDGMRIDVFLPSIPFSDEAARTRRRISDESGWSGWFLSPEALSVFKLLFFRGKDMVDLERLVAVSGPALDHAYVRRWIVEMMGEDDPRTKRWDQIVERFGG